MHDMRTFTQAILDNSFVCSAYNATPSVTFDERQRGPLTPDTLVTNQGRVAKVIFLLLSATAQCTRTFHSSQSIGSYGHFLPCK